MLSNNMYPTPVEMNFEELVFSKSYSVQGGKNQNRVDVSFPGGKRLQFQLTQDFFEPFDCKYSLDNVADDQDGNRRGQALNVTDLEVEASLKRLDEAVIQAAIKHQKDWFKKDNLSENTIRDRYRPLLQKKNEDDKYFFIKFKIKTGTSPVCTQLHKLAKGPDGLFNCIYPGTIQDLERNSCKIDNCKMSPILSTFGIYFANSSFGLTMQADEIGYIPGNSDVKPMSKIRTKREFSLLNTEDEAECKFHKVSSLPDPCDAQSQFEMEDHTDKWH